MKDRKVKAKTAATVPPLSVAEVETGIRTSATHTGRSGLTELEPGLWAGPSVAAHGKTHTVKLINSTTRAKTVEKGAELTTLKWRENI